ncbi:MAG: DUF421 domain-containing protein [Clostridia bacterium]|nr:DUF421 domain-containing protein [Clostridia bacterium]
MITILIRTLIVYFSLIATMRFMGKRQLGELEISDLVTTLLLSDIATLPITNTEIPLSHALIPILTLTSLEVVLSGLLLKVPFLKRVLSVRPAILVRHGRPDPTAMATARVSAEELLSQLRQKDIADPSEVEYAILEPNGQISIVKKAAQKEATAADLGLSPDERGMMHLLVCDGKINRRNLALAGWDEARLFRELSRRKVKLPDVFLMLADDGGRVALYPREAA